MASVAYILEDIENIIDEIERRLSVVEENAVQNYVSARKIQKVFRGYITRKHLMLLHKSATYIQKNWRGFVGRIEYRLRLKEKFNQMCCAFYSCHATVIQKCWRGFWVRLKVFSYYKLKSWLAFVLQQNKVLKCSVEENQINANEQEMKLRENEAKEWIVYILFKLHHLLRTQQLSGIYSLPNTTELSEIEKMLQCLKFKDFMVFYNSYMDDLRKKQAKELPSFIFQKCKAGARFEREYHDLKKQEGEYLFSKLSFQSPPPSALDMEIREREKLKRLEKRQQLQQQRQQLCQAKKNKGA